MVLSSNKMDIQDEFSCQYTQYISYQLPYSSNAFIQVEENKQEDNVHMRPITPALVHYSDAFITVDEQTQLHQIDENIGCIVPLKKDMLENAISDSGITNRDLNSFNMDVSMKKKKRGRPENNGPYQITRIPSRNAMRGMSKKEIQSLKYRINREKNNEASKTWRTKKKNKQKALEEELGRLQQENWMLRQKLIRYERCSGVQTNQREAPQ